MAKVTAPALSFGASGSIAKTAVYSKWKGVPYVRQHVVPSNPQTEAQQLTRTTFAQLREMWKLAPQILQGPWNAFAKGRPFTGMNKFVGENIRVIKGDANFNDFIASPGAAGGIAPEAFSVAPTANAGELELTFTTPALPDGWTLVAAQYALFQDQVPGGIFTGDLLAGEITDAPYTATVDDLTSDVEYQVGGWLQFTKPNGQIAYSVGLTRQGTPA